MEHGKGHTVHTTLEQTPTWAVAVVCTVFVVVSLLVERGINHCGQRLKRNNQKPLSKALEKMKEELMLLGFISLLLSVFQSLVSKLCIPRSFLKHMLPCAFQDTALSHTNFDQDTLNTSTHNRRLLMGWIQTGDQSCAEKGKIPMISMEGLHQLHIFIFVMAIVHLCYSCLTMLFGRLMVYWWKRWEDEVRAVDKSDAIMKTTYSKLRQQTFVREHARRPWSRLNLFNWIASFIRHLLCKPVTRADYMTLRSAFLRKYNLKREFNFHSYITRVLEDDFKVVVGISGYLWAFVIMFLLMNVHGWHTYFWMAFLPLILILVIGTKLQYIVTELACEIVELEDKTGEEAVIKPRDDLFWFNRPRLLLHLIHFTLFQNAFELAFFFWVWATFGFDTCFMDSMAFIVVRLILGLAVQFLCSYSTLPLYVIVTQMGSHYRKAIFTKQINKRVAQWTQDARSNVKQAKSQRRHQQARNKHQLGAEDIIREQPQTANYDLKRISKSPIEMTRHSTSLQQLMKEEEPSTSIQTVPSPVHRILEIEMSTTAEADFSVLQIMETPDQC